MIYVTGDTHGAEKHGTFSVDGYTNRFSSKSFREGNDFTNDDYVIVLGDFGGVWAFDSRFLPDEYNNNWLNKQKNINMFGETKEEKYNLDWLSNKPGYYCFIGGNHENYDRLYKAYEQIDFKGGKARLIRHNVLFLESGYVYTICNKKLYVMGGAQSHDIDDGVIDTLNFNTREDYKKYISKLNKKSKYLYRTKHTDWWEEEIPSEEILKRGNKSLNNVKNNVDFILTHCLPPDKLLLVSGSSLGRKPNRLEKHLIAVDRNVNFNTWLCGHYHMNKDLFGKYIVLYEQIIRIA